MKKLIDYLPRYYRNSPEIIEFQTAMQKQAEKLHAARDNLFEQFCVRSATWGLKLWETALGIKTETSKPYSYRRSRIESKLRGLGTTTVEMVKNVAESFSNGEVNVVEHNEEYIFEIIFTGNIGIPPNMDDLTAAIEEIKPAHLAYNYRFIYRTWDMVSHLTWDDISGHDWNQIVEGTI